MRPDRAFDQKFLVGEEHLSREEELVYQACLRDAMLINSRSRKEQWKLMDQFQGEYSLQEILSDKDAIASKEEKYSDRHERSEIWEYLLGETEKFGWFGNDCYITKASRFDDIENKTDLVIEWEDETGNIARLAVDCAVISNINYLGDKVRRVAKNLASGNLSSLKYHCSELTKDRKKVTQVPRVILAIEPAELTKLCKNFARIVNKDKGGKDQFSQNDIQYTMLVEIEEQLECQHKRLIKILYLSPKEEKDFIATAQKNVLRCLQKIKDLIAEKENSLDKVKVQRASSSLDSSGFRRVLKDNLLAA